MILTRFAEVCRPDFERVSLHRVSALPERLPGDAGVPVRRLRVHYLAQEVGHRALQLVGVLDWPGNPS